MLTEQRLNDAINNIIARFSGQRIAFPDGREYGQCTAIAVWLFTELGLPIPPMANDSADGWGIAFPSQLAPYFNHEAYQPGKSYPRGTIMMWNSPHIAIVLHSDGSNIAQVFEQNADPDGAPCQTTNREISNHYHQATYVLTPRFVAPTPPPTPARYFVAETYNPGKQVKLNKQPTYLWGMNYHFDQMKDNPVETHNAGEIWTVTNKVHHEDGYDYYRREGQVDGFNVLDCDDYVYTPPAAPVPVPKATKVTLVTDVPYYTIPQTAASGYKPAGTLKAGEYYQISSDLGMLNLSADNTKDLKQWVNPRDNKLPAETHPEPPLPTPQAVPPVEPEPTTGDEGNTAWKQYYVPFPTPETFIATRDYDVADIAGSRPTMRLPAYNPAISQTDGKVKVYGKFPGPDGTWYYRLKDPNDKAFTAYYGVPVLDHNGMAILIKQPTIRPATPAPTKQKASNKDTIHLVTAYMEEGTAKFMEIVPKWYKQIKK